MRFARHLTVALLAICTLGACGDGGSDADTTSAPTSGRTSAATTTIAAGTTEPTVPGGDKESTGVDGTIELPESFGPVGEPIDVVAEFVVRSPDATVMISSDQSGVATMTPVAVGPLASGERRQIDTTVTATAEGTGEAHLIAVLTKAGQTRTTRLTVYVEASDELVAYGSSSRSATSRALIDELQRRGTIDAAEHDRRIALLEGGTTEAR